MSTTRRPSVVRPRIVTTTYVSLVVFGGFSLAAMFGIPAVILLRRGSWAEDLLGSLCAAAASGVLLFILFGAGQIVFGARGVLSGIWRSNRLRLAGRSAQGIAFLAAFLAGRRRRGLDEEWLAILAGETGQDPPSWRKVGTALTFVGAAIRLRLLDIADAMWRPADAVLRSRTLSNLVVIGPTTMAASFILRHEGTLGVLTTAESITSIDATLYGLIRLGRWWRDIKPPEPPKRRRAKE